jgi:tetratricopeptide (TPR) repeat protein
MHKLTDQDRPGWRGLALCFCLGLAAPVYAQAFSTRTTDALELGRLWTQSVAAEQRRDFDGALGQMESFRRQGGDAYLAAVRTGWLLTCKDDYRGAERAYRLAAERDARALTPRLGLLTCQDHLAETNGSVQTAQAILRLDPQNYAAHMAIGRACFAAKQYARAQPSFAAAAQRYPEDAEAASYLAWTLFYTGRKTEAAPLFRRLVSMQPDYPHAARGLELTTSETPPPPAPRRPGTEAPPEGPKP